MSNNEIYKIALSQGISEFRANVIRMADSLEIGVSGVTCRFNDPDECDVFVPVVLPIIVVEV